MRQKLLFLAWVLFYPYDASLPELELAAPQALVQCLQTPPPPPAEGGEVGANAAPEHHAREECDCAHVAQSLFDVNYRAAIIEHCRQQARQLIGDAFLAFHVHPREGTCVVETCRTCRGRASPWYAAVFAPGGRGEWDTFAPRPVCPSHQLALLPDYTPVATDQAAEFMRVFGPTPLRHDQALRDLRAECSTTAHRLIATVCFGDACDEWSKFSTPRCHVSLETPSNPASMEYLHAPACGIHDLYYCPPSVPLAIRTAYKAGSRSATLWAAMIEGLLPHLVTAQRTLSAALAVGSEGGTMNRYYHEVMEHEDNRLGCTNDASLYSYNLALQHVGMNRLGLPLSLCPACCRSGLARLRVVFVRSPFARLWSNYRQWRNDRCGEGATACPEPFGSVTFRNFVGELLAPAGANATLFNRDDVRHAAPALESAVAKGEVAFLLEDPAASLRRIEAALCAPPFRHCAPLPRFPGPGSESLLADASTTHPATAAASEEWTPDMHRLVEGRYAHDLAAASFA